MRLKIFPPLYGGVGRHPGFTANRDVLHGERVRVRAHPPPPLNAQHEASRSPLQPGSLVPVGISGLSGSTGTEGKGLAEGEKQRHIHVLVYLLLLDEFLHQWAPEQRFPHGRSAVIPQRIPRQWDGCLVEYKNLLFGDDPQMFPGALGFTLSLGNTLQLISITFVGR